MEHPRVSIKVMTSNKMGPDVAKLMQNRYHHVEVDPDGHLLFRPSYEVDGEDGFVPDMIDEGRDSSSTSAQKLDLFNEDHLIKVYALSPFLFGKVFQPDRWIKYLCEVGLLATCNPVCENALTFKQLEIVEIIEKTHAVVLKDSQENNSRKKQMSELFDCIDKSVFDLDENHLKVKPLTEILDRSRKFKFLESWQQTVREKRYGHSRDVIDDRALFVAVLFTCRQFVEHWHRSKSGDSLVERFKARMKKKDKQVHRMKERGNEHFKEGSFKKASQCYTKAIHDSPFNAILYGNRAQSCLNYGSHEGALTDGKRAIVLDPGWHKGYYRCAEAYFRLKMIDKAFAIIELGLSYCPSDRNLLDQREKFRDPGKYNNNRPSTPNTEEERNDPSQESESDDSDSVPTLDSEDSDIDGAMPALVSDSEDGDEFSDSDPPDLVTGSENSDSEEEEEETRPTQQSIPDKKLEPKATKNEKNTRKGERKVSQTSRRHGSRTDSERDTEGQEKNPALTLMQEKDDRHTEVFKLLKQGSEALVDKMYPNAIFFYNKCLDIIKKHKIENITRFVELDLVLLKYSLGISCVDMGSTKEIQEGIRLFSEILNNHTSLKFPLAFHGLGRAWLKQFRFAECLETVERGLEVVLNMSQQITYTWPGTTVVIKESLSGALQESLEQMAVQCHNPPVPDAMCRYHKCHGYCSIKIYMTDPEFKGLVRLHCFAKCIVEFHVECWRRFKKDRLSQSDKDYLNSSCLTPDCDARIARIHTYDQLGATLKELETPDMGKPDLPPTKAVREKMQISSAKRIAKKEAKKEQRKQRKKELQELELRRQEEEKAGEAQSLPAPETQRQSSNNSETQGEEKGAVLMERLAEAHVYQKLEEANEESGQIGMEKYMTVLNKKEEEEEQSKKAMDSKASSKGRSKKKQKSKVTMTLDEFVGPRETADDGHTPVYMDCMDEFAADSGLPDMEDPFARPTKGPVKQELDVFDSLCTETSSVASSGSHSDNKHSEIKEALFSFFAGILSEYGPLDKDDVIIKRELEDFPAEAHEVIDSAGGIDKLLLQSLNFSVVENFVCLLQDSIKAKQLADLHKNPLKRSESPVYAHISKSASKQDFPSLGESFARTPADTYNRGNKLDELDVFTTTAGNLDSPVTSPIGVNSNVKSSATNSNSAHRGTSVRVTTSSGVNSASVTVSKSTQETIVHAVESSPIKGGKDPFEKDVHVEQKSKKPVEPPKNKDKLNVQTTQDNASGKSDATKSRKEKTDPKVPTSVNNAEVASSGQKKTEPTSSTKKKPVKSKTPPSSETKGNGAAKDAKQPITSRVGDKPEATKAGCGKGEPGKASSKDDAERTEFVGKTTPERQSAIKESFKKQVHAVAGKKPGDVKQRNGDSNKEDTKSRVEAVKRSAEEETKVTKRESAQTDQLTKAKSESQGQNTKKTETKETALKVGSNGVKQELTLVKSEQTFEDTLKSESNGPVESTLEAVHFELPFEKGQVLRSCDDVSPVTSDPFPFPGAFESGPSSQSSMQSLWSSTSLGGVKGSDLTQKLSDHKIWDGMVPLNDQKFPESGPWKSKLQEWKTPVDDGYGQLDKISDDSEFMTESRTSDKDPSPTKDVGVIGSGSVIPETQPPKFSKPPGFGGKTFNNQPVLHSSATGASKYGPIGSKSGTQSPASGSSKENSHPSTPIHSVQQQADTMDAQLPHFPSVHTGESFITRPSMMTTSLPVEVPFNNGLLINNSVWPSMPPGSFNTNLPSHPAQIGFANTDSLDRSVQSPLQQSDELFISETTDSVYNSLRDAEPFKYNPALKQHIEADIRADIERSRKSVTYPMGNSGMLTGADAVKPAVKMRNMACQCTPQEYGISVGCNTEPYEPYKEDYLRSKMDLEVTNTRLHELMDKHTQLQNSSNAELKNLRSLVDALEQECKGLRRDRTKATEERESESKKWNSERKTVAEEMKTLKKEMKNAKFREENALRQLQEKDTLISTLNRQLNVERETIVSEREKFQSDKEELHSLHSMQLSRAETAEVNLLKLKVEVGTQILERSLKDAEMYATQSQQMLLNMRDTKQTPPSQLVTTADQWKATVQKIKCIKQESMTQFEEQIRQIHQGTPLSALQQLPIPRPPPAPENPMAVMSAFMRNNPGGFQGRGKVPTGAIPTNRPPNVRLPTTVANQKSGVQAGGTFTGPPPLSTKSVPVGRPNNPIASQHKSKSAFDKIMDKLTTLFPNLARSDITNYIQDLRNSRNGSLSGMTLDNIVMGVAEMILKDNARKATKQASLHQGSNAVAPSNYQTVTRMSPNPDRGGTTGGASSNVPADEIFEEEEDPCIICHDELNAAATIHLECCHRFHTECIRKWFREQSTCPTCRVHALLPDDFPSLG